MRFMTSRLVLGVTVIGVLLAAFGTIHLTQPAWYERLWHPFHYQQIVLGHAHNYHLDPALLASVIYQESKFRADARSDRGAIGLMQLLPATAKGIAERTGGAGFRVSDLYSPEINVRYGAWYLRHLLDKYGSERTALAAYNAGQHNVDSWRARGLDIQFDETKHFVDRVEQLKRIYRHAYSSLRLHTSKSAWRGRSPRSSTSSTRRPPRHLPRRTASPPASPCVSPIP
jgi:soluble lytic murein transglycosylase